MCDNNNNLTKDHTSMKRVLLQKVSHNRLVLQKTISKRWRSDASAYLKIYQNEFNILINLIFFKTFKNSFLMEILTK